MDGNTTAELLPSDQFTKQLQGIHLSWFGEDDGAKDDKGDGAEPPKKPDGDTAAPDIQAKIEEAARKATEEAERRWQSKFDQKNTEATKAQKELETLRKAQMSDEERKKAEEEEQRKKDEQRAKELQERELRIHRLETLTDESLPKNAEKFLVGTTPDEIKKSAADLKGFINAEVEKQVNERLGKGPKPSGGAQGNNPWSKESFNLTEQAKMLKENPAEAAKLKAAAGL